MKPVIFHRDAEADLEIGVAWYEKQRVGLGADLREKVEDAVERILDNPAKHLRYKRKDIRKCRVKRFPYTIYFLELEDAIWIAAVAHDKRKPDYWATREPED